MEAEWLETGRLRTDTSDRTCLLVVTVSLPQPRTTRDESHNEDYLDEDPLWTRPGWDRGSHLDCSMF